MLRRVDTARIEFVPGFFTGKGFVALVIGRRVQRLGNRKLHKSIVDQQFEQQRSVPVFLCIMEGRHYWQFQDRIYSDNDGLDAREVHALLVTRQERERRKVERAVAMLDQGARETPSARQRIPDDVKQLVWGRDGGACVACGSTSELQFDHVIPVALGGSNEPSNLQLLCGPCNRRKGAGLTMGGR